MNTKQIRIMSTEDNPLGLKEVAEILNNGGIVGIPTETVYGLAANAYDESAVAKIFEAKGRPQDNPLIVHIADMNELEVVAAQIPESAKKLAAAFWPGPLTMVLKRTEKIPASVSAGLDTVAVRMPSNEVARAIIEVSGLPLAAPSANISGRPSPTTAQHVIDDLGGKIDAVVVSGDCSVGVESTVISLVDGKNRLLRPGGITHEQLESVIGPVEIDSSVLSSEISEKVSSPGMKYKHYSPKTRVIIIEADTDLFCDYVNQRNENCAAMCFSEEAEHINKKTVIYGQMSNDMSQARELFDALRVVDILDVDVVYAHSPKKSGVGLAVYNRLLRAAAFEVIKL
ncbi:MAG: threonylcarbamoyl-AMP synthase [Clostridia bacterium]|nr:threonylcarbamoyl-AMP synthase [Clostridia bacterium]